MYGTKWKMSKASLAGLVTVVLLGATGVANAALYLAPNGQGIYDSDQNITWLANANLAATNTFGLLQLASNATYVTGSVSADGLMDWYTAETWIAAMNSTSYLGVNNWRLPVTTQPDATCQYQVGPPMQGGGLHCYGSEMGQLFYVSLHGLPGQATFNPMNRAGFSGDFLL